MRVASWRLCAYGEYGDAFKSDVLAALLEAALDTGGKVGGLSGHIDSYCKEIMARKLKAVGSEKANFKVISTQARTIARASDSSHLKGSQGGYGEPFDGDLLVETLASAAPFVALKSAGARDLAVAQQALRMEARERQPDLRRRPARLHEQRVHCTTPLSGLASKRSKTPWPP